MVFYPPPCLLVSPDLLSLLYLNSVSSYKTNSHIKNNNSIKQDKSKSNKSRHDTQPKKKKNQKQNKEKEEERKESTKSRYRCRDSHIQTLRHSIKSQK